MMAPTAVLPLWCPMMPPTAAPVAAPMPAPFDVLDMFEQLRLDVARASTSTLVANFFMRNPPPGCWAPDGSVCRVPLSFGGRKTVAKLEPQMQLCKEICVIAGGCGNI